MANVQELRKLRRRLRGVNRAIAELQQIQEMELGCVISMNSPQPAKLSEIVLPDSSPYPPSPHKILPFPGEGRVPNWRKG